MGVCLRFWVFEFRFDLGCLEVLLGVVIDGFDFAVCCLGLEGLLVLSLLVYGSLCILFVCVLVLCVHLFGFVDYDAFDVDLVLSAWIEFLIVLSIWGLVYIGCCRVCAVGVVCKRRFVVV